MTHVLDDIALLRADAGSDVSAGKIFLAISRDSAKLVNAKRRRSCSTLCGCLVAMTSDSLLAMLSARCSIGTGNSLARHPLSSQEHASRKHDSAIRVIAQGVRL